MSTGDSLHRRRRDPRVVVPATALLFDDDGAYLGHAVVDDLSSGGARLTGPCDVAVGEAITVVIQPAGAAPFSVYGRVAHRDPAGDQVGLGVAFLIATREAEDALRATLRRGAARAPETRVVVVVSRSQERIDRVSLQVHELGHFAVAAESYDDVRYALEDFEDLVELVVFDRQLDGVDALIARIADRHPTVRRAVFAPVVGRGRPAIDQLAGVPVTMVAFPPPLAQLEFAMAFGARW